MNITLDSGERVVFARRTYWSPVAGCYVERVSMADAHGQEHWVEHSHTRGWRETRRRALEAINENIRAGGDPGRVPFEEIESCL